MTQLAATGSLREAGTVNSHVSLQAQRAAFTAKSALALGDTRESVLMRSSSSHMSELASAKSLNSLSYTPDYLLYDYDFTDFAVTLLANKSTTGRTGYYYSTLFSDRPAGEFISKIKGL